MWNCNFFPFSGRWGGGFTGDILSLLIWGGIVLLLIYLVIMVFRKLGSNPTTSSRDRADSIDVLKMRFAKGEMSQEEFNKMKQILSQS